MRRQLSPQATQAVQSCRYRGVSAATLVAHIRASAIATVRLYTITHGSGIFVST
jgi:hypothetical protein